MAKDKKNKKKNPESEVVPILRKITGQRKARAFFMRKTTANLMEKLTNEEQDAMVQIAIVLRAMSGSSMYRQMRYGELPGAKVEEYSAFIIDMIRRYREWEYSLRRNRPCIDVTIEICTENETVSSISDIRRKSWGRIMEILKDGLAQWVILTRHEKQISLTSNDNHVG